MLLLQQGEQKAFNELYSRYSKRLLQFIYKMLNYDQPKAQDILQDTFLRVIEKSHLYDSNHKFYSWLFTIAANLCRNEIRKYKQDTLGVEEIEHELADPEKEKLFTKMDASLFKAHLKTALTELSHDHKAVFILRYQEKMAIKEIATIMDCSEGTIKSRIYYATKQLAEKLEVFNTLLKH